MSHFVGQIIAKENDEPQVKFARFKEASDDSKICVWKEPEDISLVRKENVVKTDTRLQKKAHIRSTIYRLKQLMINVSKLANNQF